MNYHITQLIIRIARKLLGREIIDMTYMRRKEVEYCGRRLNIIVDSPTYTGMKGKILVLLNARND